MNFPPATFVNTPDAWETCLNRLHAAKRFALDLEANSLYAYREQICLMQISLPDQDYVIDPLADLDFAGMGHLIEDPHIEKVLHSGEYDLILMKKQFDWQMSNLFDTMWAARILGYAHMGLANILKDRYGVELDKRHQKANWCRRPLSASQLEYAQSDTHFLLTLRDDFATALQAAGHWEEAMELFQEQCQVHPAEQTFDPDGFWSVNGVRDLSRQQQAILRALYIFREKEAERQDRPPFKIFGGKTMLQLAREAPEHLDDLRSIHGMTTGQVKRYGQKILQAIRQGRQDGPPRRPARGPRLPEEVVNRYDLLHEWRRRRAVARGVESDVILSRQSLWDLAHANPRDLSELASVSSLGPWRQQQYGQEIIRLLQKKQQRR
ncbi:MAG: HRDC domain-containing protein [Anaerolineales bacterium]|nr:HRDC domain-containing protein [Anaerolineales bacterium]MCB8952346.1 HRDC domain-containing protein [Ardenticatenales bacterium]